MIKMKAIDKAIEVTTANEKFDNKRLAIEIRQRINEENEAINSYLSLIPHISDVNMCYTEHARRYLNSEGVAKERTYVMGSPMPEVLSKNIERIDASDVLTKLGLEKGKYILLSASLFTAAACLRRVSCTHSLNFSGSSAIILLDSS